MKIYTKTGDQGTTGLAGGERVLKNAPRISACGDVDELNTVLGVVRAETPHEPIRKALGEVQLALLAVGAQLACPKGPPKCEVITTAHVDSLERQIDVISEIIPPLEHFITPGGGKTAAYLHMARAVCRRAERGMVRLSSLPNEAVDHWLLVYINRLSDFLFVLARLSNQLDSKDETEWVPQNGQG